MVLVTFRAYTRPNGWSLTAGRGHARQHHQNPMQDSYDIADSGRADGCGGTGG
jgi:hypothetical protein